MFSSTGNWPKTCSCGSGRPATWRFTNEHQPLGKYCAICWETKGKARLTEASRTIKPNQIYTYGVSNAARDTIYRNGEPVLEVGRPHGYDNQAEVVQYILHIVKLLNEAAGT